jgi:hypothetical protein
MPRRSACCRRTIEPRATGHIRDHRHDPDPDREGLRLPRRQRRRVLRRAQVRGLRQAVRQEDRGPARRRARRGRRGQAGSARLRAVEGRQARRAELGFALGAGRPGWHIECSAMSTAAWASTSTSTAAARTCSSRTTRTRSPRARAPPASTFVNYWMHNGFVRVDDEKMSKSLGNFFTIREVLKVRPRGGALLHPRQPLPQPAQLLADLSPAAPHRCA